MNPKPVKTKKPPLGSSKAAVSFWHCTDILLGKPLPGRERGLDLAELGTV